MDIRWPGAVLPRVRVRVRFRVRVSGHQMARSSPTVEIFVYLLHLFPPICRLYLDIDAACSCSDGTYHSIEMFRDTVSPRLGMPCLAPYACVESIVGGVHHLRFKRGLGSGLVLGSGLSDHSWRYLTCSVYTGAAEPRLCVVLKTSALSNFSSFK